MRTKTDRRHLPKGFGAKLRSVRNGLGLSQRAFASRLGIGVVTLQRYEKEDFAPPPALWERVEAAAKTGEIQPPTLVIRVDSPISVTIDLARIPPAEWPLVFKALAENRVVFEVRGMATAGSESELLTAAS